MECDIDTEDKCLCSSCAEEVCWCYAGDEEGRCNAEHFCPVTECEGYATKEEAEEAETNHTRARSRAGKAIDKELKDGGIKDPLVKLAWEFHLVLSDEIRLSPACDGTGHMSMLASVNTDVCAVAEDLWLIAEKAPKGGYVRRTEEEYAAFHAEVVAKYPGKPLPGDL